MTGIRAAAIVTIALLGGYHVMRLAARACTGTVCDAYIPLSLLLPLLVLFGAAVTGVMAMAAARHDRSWLVALSICSAVGVVGPVVALIVWRDSPDAFGVSSSVLVLLPPAGALLYSFTKRPT